MKKPEGQFVCMIGTTRMDGGASVNPSHFYQVAVDTLGGHDTIRIEAAPKKMQTVNDFVRHIQLVGSLMYWRRRFCEDTAKRIRETTTADEKAVLNTVADPVVGRVLGLGPMTETQLTAEEADKKREGLKAAAEAVDRYDATGKVGRMNG
jgi:hypothetical protein